MIFRKLAIGSQSVQQTQIRMFKCVSFILVLSTFAGATYYVESVELAVGLLGKAFIVVTFSWHIAAFVFKKLIVKKLGRVNPKNKAVFITGR